MSFVNLGNTFVPKVQVRGASNSLKIPTTVSFFQNAFLTLKAFNFLKTLKRF